MKFRDFDRQGGTLSEKETFVWKFVDFLNARFLAAFQRNMLKLVETTNFEVSPSFF